MKKLLFLLLIGKGAFGATIRMEFTGTIDQVTEGDLFPVDESFRVIVDYETPNMASFVDSDSVIYNQIPVNARLEIGTENFLMREMFVFVSLLPDPSSGDFLTSFSPSNPFGDILIPPFRSNNLNLNILSDEVIFDDSNRLPSSLDQWDLNSGNREVTFLLEEEDVNGGAAERWAFQSSSLSLISLSSIPEPSTAGLLALAAGGLFFRRRKVSGGLASVFDVDVSLK